MSGPEGSIINSSYVYATKSSGGGRIEVMEEVAVAVVGTVVKVEGSGGGGGGSDGAGDKGGSNGGEIQAKAFLIVVVAIVKVVIQK